jgi:peroxiredoxin
MICMIELGQLEARHEDFAKRNTRVVAVSLDNLEDSTKTQEKFPHLVIVSDEKESLAKAVEVIAQQHSPTGSATLAPTTALIDRAGVVRWVSRKDTLLARPAPDEVLQAVDAHGTSEP